MTKQPLPALALILCFVFGPGLSAERSVSVERFDELAIARTLHYPARVVNLRMADIASETSGRIIDFPVQVGDTVKAGQLLLEIDCTSARINEKRIQAGLNRLTAARELTRQQLDRASRLVKSNSISREELDQRQTQLNADDASIEEQRAQLESARLEVQRCRLNAPYSATVVDKKGHAGAYATPGTPQLTLVQPEAVEIELNLPLSVVPILRESNDARFVMQDDTYALKIRSVVPLIDAQSLQQTIRLSITQTDKPAGGSYGRVAFSTARDYLPPQFVEKRNGRFGVFVADRHIARFVVLNNVEEGQAARAELSADTLIITSDLKRLNDQDPVSISH